MEQHQNSFDMLWVKMVEDTNTYLEKGGDSSARSRVESLIDSLCLAGAWIQDRLDGRIATVENVSYRGSLAKKIRKALGYNL